MKILYFFLGLVFSSSTMGQDFNELHTKWEQNSARQVARYCTTKGGIKTGQCIRQSEPLRDVLGKRLANASTDVKGAFSRCYISSANFFVLDIQKLWACVNRHSGLEIPTVDIDFKSNIYEVNILSQEKENLGSYSYERRKPKSKYHYEGPKKFDFGPERRNAGWRFGFTWVPHRVSRCGTKRFCYQMANCSEAKYHFKTCGIDRLDGDNDGIPCEDICK